VIRQRDLGEADRIVVLYTRERGKVSAVAKGTKRLRSKLAGSLQLFSHASVQVAAGRSLEVATQARPIDSHYNLRRDMRRYAHASYAAELLDALTDEGLADPELFDVFVATLEAMDAGGDPPTMVRAFELKLMARLGYGPELESCVSCGGDVGGGGRGFSVSQGGVLCGGCLAAEGGVGLSAAGLQALRELSELETEVVAGRRLARAAREETGRLMRAFVDFRVDRQLRSAAFLTQEE